MSNIDFTPERFIECFTAAPDLDGMPEVNGWLAKFRQLAPASQSRVLLALIRDDDELFTELTRILPDQSARKRFIDALTDDARGDAA